METPYRPARLPALDGLRGLAILLVLGAHLFADAIADSGWAGVDLFFVLSGFLITGVLLDGARDPHRVRTFYVRRALRIFPLYYGVLLAFLVIVPLARISYFSDVPGHRSTWAVTTRELAWFWPYLTNWSIGLLRPHRPGPLSHFWSLAVEEQFYLIWPLIVWRCSRRTAFRVAVVAFLGSCALRAVLVLDGAPYLTAYVLTPCRLEGLAMGAMIAIGIRSPDGLERVRRAIAAPASIAGGVIVGLLLWRGTLTNTDPWVETIGITALAVAFGGLLVVTLAHDPATLRLAPLRWAGTYSYGLYVLHPFVIRGLELGTKLEPGDWPFTTTALALSAAVAWVSYRWYEGPFLRLKDRLAPVSAPPADSHICDKSYLCAPQVV